MSVELLKLKILTYFYTNQWKYNSRNYFTGRAGFKMNCICFSVVKKY